MNIFVNLPVPASNSAGAAVDVSAMGMTKTVILGGTLDAAVTIEYATDAGTDFAPLMTFQDGGNVTIDVAAHWMRAVTSAYKSGAGNCDVGASNAGSSFVQIPTIGTPVDISALPLFKTVVAAPGFAGNVEVTQDGISWAQVMTFANGGGQSGSFFGAEARVTGGGAGSVWIGGAEAGAGGGSPVFPPSPYVTTIIYARTTGSDATGNGSLANPYRTFARSILDVPHVINPGYRFVIDITDIGVETLAQEWASPVIKSPGDLYLGDTFQPYFTFGTQFTIRATPKLALPGTDAIITAGAVTATVAGLCKLTDPSKAWTPGALKGMQVINPTVGFGATCCVYDNTATELFLCNTASAFNGGVGPLGATVNVVEPSATLQGPPANGNREGMVFGDCSTMNFQGIKFTSTVPLVGNGGAGFFGQFSPFFEGCVLEEASFGNCGQLQVGLFSTTVRGTVNSFLSQLTPLRSFWDTVTSLQIGGLTHAFRTTVLENCATISSGVAVGTGFASPTDLNFTNCLFKTSAGDAIDLTSPTRLNMLDCQIDGSAGDAINANGPCKVVLSGVTGSGNTGYGVRTDDGPHVEVDAATTVGNADARAYHNGSLAPVVAWPGVPFNSTDGVTLSRIWEP